MREYVMDFLKMNDVKYKEDTSLSDMSPIKIGGKTDLVIYPTDESVLAELVRFLEDSKIRYKILGRMSNVLPPDEKFEKIIVKTDLINSISLAGNRLAVSAGVSLPFLCSQLKKMGLSGLEELSGIPGSVGGALFGNAGAFGREIADVVDSVKAFDRKTRRIFILNAKEAEFSYRHSVFSDGDFAILSAELILKLADSEKIRCAIDRFNKIRRDTQPIGEPSLGSTFKRPEKNIFAAKLIDDCGLKGYKIGGAMISKRHAGFIINKDFATARDYKLLCKYVQKCVYEKFLVNLECEVEFL